MRFRFDIQDTKKIYSIRLLMIYVAIKTFKHIMNYKVFKAIDNNYLTLYL